MRLIDVDAAIKEAISSDAELGTNIWETPEVVDFLEDCPTVDIAPVVHGRLGVPYIDEYYGEFAKCMECGTENIVPCNYCNGCGAKMDGGANT